MTMNYLQCKETKKGAQRAMPSAPSVVTALISIILFKKSWDDKMQHEF
jgi:hypothetical protein